MVDLLRNCGCFTRSATAFLQFHVCTVTVVITLWLFYLLVSTNDLRRFPDNHFPGKTCPG